MGTPQKCCFLRDVYGFTRILPKENSVAVSMCHDDFWYKTPFSNVSQLEEARQIHSRFEEEFSCKKEEMAQVVGKQQELLERLDAEHEAKARLELQLHKAEGEAAAEGPHLGASEAQGRGQGTAAPRWPRPPRSWCLELPVALRGRSASPSGPVPSEWEPFAPARPCVPRGASAATSPTSVRRHHRGVQGGEGQPAGGAGPEGGQRAGPGGGAGGPEAAVAAGGPAAGGAAGGQLRTVEPEGGPGRGRGRARGW